MDPPLPDDSSVEEVWPVEFTAAAGKQVRALEELGVNCALCWMVMICKTGDGKFFALWEQQHCERGFFDDYFGGEISKPAERSVERLIEWADLVKRMPTELFREEITRRQAFEIIASLWLPSEFHGDAGL